MVPLSSVSVEASASGCDSGCSMGERRWQHILALYYHRTVLPSID